MLLWLQQPAGSLISTHGNHWEEMAILVLSFTSKDAGIKTEIWPRSCHGSKAAWQKVWQVFIRIGKQQPTKQSDFSNFQDSKVQQTSQESNSQSLYPGYRDGHAHCSSLLSRIKDSMFSHTEHPINKQWATATGMEEASRWPRKQKDWLDLRANCYLHLNSAVCAGTEGSGSSLLVLLSSQRCYWAVTLSEHTCSQSFACMELHICRKPQWKMKRHSYRYPISLWKFTYPELFNYIVFHFNDVALDQSLTHKMGENWMSLLTPRT